MSTQTVVTAILSMTNTELNEVVDAIKYRRNQLTRQLSKTFKRGDLVEFKGKTGRKIQGKILKVNPKTCIVKEDSARTEWRVTSSLLRLVHETA